MLAVVVGAAAAYWFVIRDDPTLPALESRLGRGDADGARGPYHVRLELDQAYGGQLAFDVVVDPTRGLAKTRLAGATVVIDAQNDLEYQIRGDQVSLYRDHSDRSPLKAVLGRSGFQAEDRTGEVVSGTTGQGTFTLWLDGQERFRTLRIVDDRLGGVNAFYTYGAASSIGVPAEARREPVQASLDWDARTVTIGSMRHAVPAEQIEVHLYAVDGIVQKGNLAVPVVAEEFSFEWRDRGQRGLVDQGDSVRYLGNASIEMVVVYDLWAQAEVSTLHRSGPGPAFALLLAGLALMARRLSRRPLPR